MQTPPAESLPSYEDVVAAHSRIRAYARRTPVLTSATIDALTGAKVHFKCENLQRMGAFKFRGAYNALSHLSQDEKSRGVVAFSSGNHAQAVALAARSLWGAGAPVTWFHLDAYVAMMKDLMRKTAGIRRPGAAALDLAAVAAGRMDGCLNDDTLCRLTPKNGRVD